MPKRQFQSIRGMRVLPGYDLKNIGRIGLLKENVPLYSCLPVELRLLLQERVARFISSTRFEGCNGLEPTEEMILTVAAQARMLVMHRKGEPCPKLVFANECL